MRRMLITGGAGFIGINSADYFLKRGWNVAIADNMSRKGADDNIEWIKSRNHENLEVHKVDIRYDKEKLCELAEGADAILHLAAQVAVTTSVKDPAGDFEINAAGTINVLEAARKSSKKPIVVYSSTNKVYGRMEDLEVVEKDEEYDYKDIPEGVDEERNLDFHSPYGCSKGCADQYVRDYSRIYGLKTVVFRQSCIYGPHQFGVEDQGWVAWFIIAVLLNKPLTIYGNGKQVRDLLFVEDLVESYEKAIENIDKASGKVYNMGGGSQKKLSLLQLLKMLEKMTGEKISTAFSEWRPGDQPVFIADIGKAKRELGWEPKTSVEEGIKKLFAWASENKEAISRLV